MAIAEKNLRKNVYVKLQTGADSYAFVSMGSVNPGATLNNSTLWSIKNAMAPILEGSVVSIQKIIASEVYEEE